MALGLAILAGGIWLLIRSLGEREVLYQGKSLYYWSEQIKSPNPAASNQASQVRDKDLHFAVEEALKKIDLDAAAQAGVRIGGRPAVAPKPGDR